MFTTGEPRNYNDEDCTIMFSSSVSFKWNMMQTAMLAIVLFVRKVSKVFLIMS